MADLSGLSQALGGIGLFLLGMVMMTEGLQGLAGQSLRRGLRRFTRTPLRGVFAGAGVTAILQSSSATTVTVIGFVGAGLLSFEQGLGVVFGANIGTTFTGWLVALLGFRVDLEVVALPLVFIGGLGRLFGGRRVALGGGVLAGFALLFLGIGVMQEGMSGLERVLTPEQLPGDTFWGRVQLVLIGAAITAVTQSSSAGVATALVALNTGMIGFAQAAVMVIGMNIGTTVTAMLATLGGSIAARRTGMAHVLFNLFVGALAFVLLWPFAPIAQGWIEARGTSAGQLALVMFHTGFNVIGVMVALTVVKPFARLVRRLVREERDVITERLDEQLLSDPVAAVDAAAATVAELSAFLAGLLSVQLSPTGRMPGDGQKLRRGLRAVDETRSYMEKINSAALQGRARERFVDTLHVLDHAARLAFRLSQEERSRSLHGEVRLHRLAKVTRCGVIRTLEPGDMAAKAEWLNRLQAILAQHQRKFRAQQFERAGEIGGSESTEIAMARMDAARWLHRVCYHVWRICYHLDRIERSRDEVVTSDRRGEAREDVRAD